MQIKHFHSSRPSVWRPGWRLELKTPRQRGLQETFYLEYYWCLSVKYKFALLYCASNKVLERKMNSRNHKGNAKRTAHTVPGVFIACVGHRALQRYYRIFK